MLAHNKKPSLGRNFSSYERAGSMSYVDFLSSFQSTKTPYRLCKFERTCTAKVHNPIAFYHPAPERHHNLRKISNFSLPAQTSFELLPLIPLLLLHLSHAVSSALPVPSRLILSVCLGDEQPLLSPYFCAALRPSRHPVQ